MATLNISIDPKSLAQLASLKQTTEKLDKSLRYVAARSMTEGVKAAKEKLSQTILPQIKGGATNWTRRGLIASYAKHTDLTANVGWQYGGGAFSDSKMATMKGVGIPSGRYMENLARGGDRRPKSSELVLRRAGILQPGQFITPAKARGGIRIDSRGNVSGSEYQRVLSRVKAFTAEGSTQNATTGPGSRGRSAAKRRQSDYFIMRYEGGRPSRYQLNASPAFIAKRTGRGGRGFVPAFFIVDQPNYERKLNIQSIAMREYERVFTTAWRKGLADEIAFMRSRGQ